MGDPPPHVVGRVAAIGRYPVKSLQGEALDLGELDTAGLVGDRSWGIVDAETGHVLTAKRVDALLDATATLTPDGPTIELPDGTALHGPGPRTDAALSAWLGRDVVLRAARTEPTTFQMSFDVDDPEHDVFDWTTPAGSFLDLAPVHLLTTAALAAAAANQPDSAWSPHRFRPTVLIDTDDSDDTTDSDLVGFVENDWVGAALAIGTAVLDITMPTIRCSLPTKAQAVHGLERDLHVFKSLAAANHQNLGAYATVATPGTVRVGDTVELRAP